MDFSLVLRFWVTLSVTHNMANSGTVTGSKCCINYVAYILFQGDISLSLSLFLLLSYSADKFNQVAISDQLSLK